MSDAIRRSTTTPTIAERNENTLAMALRNWQGENRLLTWSVWFNVALLALALVAMPFDHRHLLGINLWVKPMKFDVSAIIYGLTVAVLLRLLAPRFVRARWVAGLLIGVAMIVENGIISLQSLRGVRSHMNVSTLFDGLAFATMGIFIIVNTVAVAVLFVLWCRRHRTALPDAVVWGIRLGLFAFLAGSLEGATMMPHLAHTVGGPDGGPGLPVVNWSTAHGDLRVAHFFALHALQAMPLLGLLLAKTRWPERRQVLALGGGFVAYMGGLWMLFAQAMAGHPFLR